MENYELTLAEFVRIAKKRKWIIGFSFVAVFFATVLFTNLRPSIYQASVKIMVERNEDKGGTLIWDVEPNLETEVQVIKSFPVMRELVERIENIPNDPALREQEIVNRAFAYQGSIDVEQIEGSNIISITATANTARKAELIANTLAEVYVTEDVEGRKRQAHAVIDYVQKELEEQRNKLVENESRMHAFKQNERIFIVTAEKKAALDRMTVKQAFSFERDVLRIEGLIAAIDKEKARRADSALFSYIDDSGLFNDVLFIGLNRRLLEFEFERFLLLIDYTEEHPTVKAKIAEIDEAKQQMRSLIYDISGLSMTSTMEKDLALVVDEMFLNDQKEVLSRIINKSYEESGALSSDQLKYLELKREIESTLAAYQRLLTKKDEANLALVREVANITVLSPAARPKVPISPNKQVNYLIGILVGGLFALMVGFAVENIDTSISTLEDIEKNLGFSVLGTIPFIESKREHTFFRRSTRKHSEERSRMVTVFQPSSREAESFKTLRTNLVQTMRRENKKVILFSSAMQEEGKSTIATNVAVSLAELGLKTILVGANLRRPTAYKFFGIDREPGLSDILIGKIAWREAVRNAADLITGEIEVDRFIHLRGIDNLRIITSGSKIVNPSEILDNVGMDRLLSDLRGAFDAVIIDCSPVLPVTDTLTLSNKVDGVVLVYRVAKTKRESIKRAKIHLENVGADICGIVLNDIKKEEQLGAAAYHYRDEYVEIPSQKSGIINQSLTKLTSVFM